MNILIDTDKASAYLAERVRSQRDFLLSQSDWTMVPDSSADKEVWGPYRQALRDLTEQKDFPYQVSWPTMTIDPGVVITIGANSFWTIANGEVN